MDEVKIENVSQKNERNNRTQEIFHYILQNIVHTYTTLGIIRRLLEAGRGRQ